MKFCIRRSRRTSSDQPLNARQQVSASCKSQYISMLHPMPACCNILQLGSLSDLLCLGERLQGCGRDCRPQGKATQLWNSAGQLSNRVSTPPSNSPQQQAEKATAPLFRGQKCGSSRHAMEETSCSCWACDRVMRLLPLLVCPLPALRLGASLCFRFSLLGPLGLL